MLLDSGLVAVDTMCCCGGACCFGGSCSEGYTEGDCTDEGGIFQGYGTDCSGDNPCNLPPDCTCGFEAFDGSGRRFLVKTEHVVRTSSQDFHSGSDDCNVSTDTTTTTTVNPFNCSSEVTCEGTSHFTSVHGGLDLHCTWSPFLGGCTFFGDGGCASACVIICTSCSPSTVSATVQSCSCDFGPGPFNELAHLEHTITLSNECISEGGGAFDDPFFQNN